MMRQRVAHRTQACTSLSRSHLHVKGWNEYYLKGLYLVRPTFQPCIIGFQINLAQTFTMMRWRVPHKTQACTSKVKVTLRGQNEYCLIGLPCPACISTMHLRILKLLDTHGHHDMVTCTSKVNVTLRGQRSKWVLFDRTILSGPHLNHAPLDSQVTGHTCSPWWGGFYLKGHGQRSKWVPVW